MRDDAIITVIFFLVFFLLISWSHFKRRIIEIAGPHLERRRSTATIIDDINALIRRFLLVRVVTAAVVAFATSTGSGVGHSRDCLFPSPVVG